MMPKLCSGLENVMLSITPFIVDLTPHLCLVYQSGEPRTEKMQVDQDWTAVYPAAAPFRPGSVPLPVRMGYPVKRGVPPEKKGNLELIKVRVHPLSFGMGTQFNEECLNTECLLFF